jgi:hypothetical protein
MAVLGLKLSVRAPSSMTHLEMRPVKLPSKLLQAVEHFLKIGDELIMGSGLDDHIIHESFNIAV